MKIRTLLISLAFVGLIASCNNAKDWSEEDLIQIGDGIAIAQTEYGQIQGFIFKGIYTFLGVPYGAPTGGENRFMPPQAPEKWDGIKPALFWGASAPQSGGRWTNNTGTFIDHWNYYDINEDCLNLNVWTPNLDDAKRPVMVWFHGGGFTSGNSIEHDEYHGENFAREQNAVFVSVNHRLGPFGFTDLSSFGEKYKYSGNVGMMDLVFALQWVHDNIANFGGDPGNVTIMGQSGGGSKVCNLLAMESAKGLVHKAVSLSGNTTAAELQEVTQALGEFIVAKAGLNANTVDKLQEMPWEEYLQFANTVSRQFTKETGIRMGTASGRAAAFQPVADGEIIPKDGLFHPEGYSKDIPVIFSCTTAETSLSLNNAEMEDITKEGAIEYLTRNYGAETAATIIEESEKAFPDMKPIQWLDMLQRGLRTNVVNVANAKVAQGGPVYTAWFNYNPPIFNGRIRAIHTMDIAFWYQNTDMMYSHTGGGPEPRALAAQMGKTLRKFMETGDPNCGALPQWPKYTIEEGAVMWLDTESKVLYNPDEAIRAALAGGR